MTYVARRSGESLENMLKRFRKSMNRSGILKAVRKKRYFVSRGEVARIKKRKGIQKARRKARRKATRMNRRRH